MTKRKTPRAALGRPPSRATNWDDEWALQQIEQRQAVKAALEGAGDGGPYFRQAMQDAGIMDAAGNYITDPDFRPDAVEAGHPVLPKP